MVEHMAVQLSISNDADDLAKKIVQLLLDRKKRESMGRNGHDKTISQFTWDKAVTRLMETIQKVPL